MNTPLVSIIIPVYNAAPYLKETVESTLNQTYPNTEIICVNDGSSDASDVILKSFESKIKIIFQQNSGQCASSNTGIRNSSGKYIKFLDADDILDEKHIELQIKAIEGKDDYIASCEWGRFYNDNPLSAVFTPETVWKDMDPMVWIKSAMQQRSDMMPGWLWLIPRSLLDKAGYWDERLNLNNDFDFSIRLILASKGIRFAKEAKIYYRSGIGLSLSRNISQKSCFSCLLSNDLGTEKILEYENSAHTRRLCANRYQDWIYRIFPKNPTFIKESEKRIKELGGSDRKLEGGRTFKLIMFFVGWKLAKRIQFIANNYLKNLFT